MIRMAAKDHHSSYFQEPSPHQNPNLDDDDDDDEPEATVSLSDLPIYGYDISNSSTSDSEDTMKADESFEFFSEEWFADKDSNFFPNESIVFCGTLIPISKNSQEFKKRDHRSTKVDLKPGSDRTGEFPIIRPTNRGRNQDGHETRRRVLSASASASKKSRWYYYGVGLAGIPTEMDLSGIRNRQNRHRKHYSVGTEGGGEKEESGGFRRPAKGLGRLIRDLRCNGQHKSNSMVKPSLVYIPKV